MNIAVAQSGGPTCAINASLLGVIKEALKYTEIKTVYGSVNGIEGIINDRLVDIKSVIRTNEDMELLRQTPSTVLGSCRFKLPEFEKDPVIYKTILNRFNSYGIKAFFYIGGNDSMDTVEKLSRYFLSVNSDIKIIGIPKTIDNDLCETDHTPGFGSAAKYVATSLQEITRDSSVYSVRSITVVEIMGRHAGWLAASAAVLHANGESAPHLVYLPECKFSLEKFYADIEKQIPLHKAIIIVVSEGIDIDGFSLDARSKNVDAFGHEYLSGVGKFLERKISKRYGCKVRSIELNVMQRCASHISSRTDIEESETIGSAAVKEAMINGATGKIMCFKRILDMPYTVRIEPEDACKIANKEKFFPLEWLNTEQNNISDDALKYFLPLIEGEQIIRMKNGIPVHYKVGDILDKYIKA